MSALSRKPWPMRWIVLVIVLCIGPYTYVNLKYRKPNKVFEPYADMKEQANVKQLLEAGYNRVTVRAERPFPALAPSEITRGTPAQLAPAPGGLPEPLGQTLVEIPRLPLGYRSLVAPAEVSSLMPLRLQFTAQIETDHEQLGGAQVFVRENSVVIVPTFEPVPGKLQARTRESDVLLTLPAGALQPGEHIFTLAGARDSIRWTVLVR
jgi:hypothetical protein